MALPTVFQKPVWDGLIRETDIPKNYIGARWFPDQGVPADELVNDLRLDRNPMAPFVTLDSEIPIIGDNVYQRIRTAVAYIRFRKIWTEKELRIWHEVAANPNSEIAARQLQALEDIRDYANLLSGAIDATKEWMRMSALFEGEVDNSWDTDRKVRIKVTWPGLTKWTDATNLYGTKYWDQSGSDPIQDIGKMIVTVEDTGGVRPGAMIVSRDVLWVLSRNSAVLNLWSSTRGIASANQPTALTMTQVQQFIQELHDVQVILYRAKYSVITDTSTEPTITKTDMVDDKKIVLLPGDATVGTMAVAPGSARGGAPAPRARYTWVHEALKPPYTVETGVGEHCFPKFTWPKRVLSARVLNSSVW